MFNVRDLHQMPLPDSETNGISLCDGRLTGLTNLTRWGDAAIDERYKKSFLIIYG